MQLDGITHSTVFQIAGFERQWWWDRRSDESGFDYGFVIEPDGNGGFYDFSNVSEPRKSTYPTASFHCNRAKPDA